MSGLQWEAREYAAEGFRNNTYKLVRVWRGGRFGQRWWKLWWSEGDDLKWQLCPTLAAAYEAAEAIEQQARERVAQQTRERREQSEQRRREWAERRQGA